MRATYSPEVDAAYLYLREIEPGGSTKQVPVHGLPAGDVILDLDSEGRLVGIEVLNASRVLPHELLAAAKRPGDVSGR